MCICNDTGFIIISKREWVGDGYFDVRIVKELQICPNEKCNHRFIYKENISDYSMPNIIPEFYSL